MIRIAWDQGFGKIYRKKVRNDALLKQRFWKAIELFLKNPFHPRLRTHKLSGKLEGLLAFTVAYDCRVVFKFLNGDEVLLVDVGGHEEVY
jgi:mRNA-degrading endonuclease YafQ of YafQ-DinJ toxin-antitoxin module